MLDAHDSAEPMRTCPAQAGIEGKAADVTSLDAQPGSAEQAGSQPEAEHDLSSADASAVVSVPWNAAGLKPGQTLVLGSKGRDHLWQPQQREHPVADADAAEPIQSATAGKQHDPDKMAGARDLDALPADCGSDFAALRADYTEGSRPPSPGDSTAESPFTKQAPTASPPKPQTDQMQSSMHARRLQFDEAQTPDADARTPVAAQDQQAAVPAAAGTELVAEQQAGDNSSSLLPEQQHADGPQASMPTCSNARQSSGQWQPCAGEHVEHRTNLKSGTAQWVQAIVAAEPALEGGLTFISKSQVTPVSSSSSSSISLHARISQQSALCCDTVNAPHRRMALCLSGPLHQTCGRIESTLWTWQPSRLSSLGRW